MLRIQGFNPSLKSNSLQGRVGKQSGTFQAVTCNKDMHFKAISLLHVDKLLPPYEQLFQRTLNQGVSCFAISLKDGLNRGLHYSMPSSDIVIARGQGLFIRALNQAIKMNKQYANREEDIFIAKHNLAFALMQEPKHSSYYFLKQLQAIELLKDLHESCDRRLVESYALTMETLVKSLVDTTKTNIEKLKQIYPIEILTMYTKPVPIN